MSPNQHLSNDKIKIMAHIDPCNSNYTYMRMRTMNSYIRANLDGLKAHLKIINQAKNTNRMDLSLFQLTQNTMNNY